MNTTYSNTSPSLNFWNLNVGGVIWKINLWIDFE